MMHIQPDNEDTQDPNHSSSGSFSGGPASEASTSEGGDDSHGDGRDSALQQMEKDARSMGWRPEDEWDGPAGKWIDAKTFIERGEQIMPILRANNKKMREELLTRDKELSTLRESVATANKALSALRKSYNESTKREVESAIADLKEQYRQARADNDVDLELKVKENIDKLTDKAAQIGKDEVVEGEGEGEASNKKGNNSELSPEFLEWQDKNKWFGNAANPDDKARTETILKIGERLRRGGEKSTGLAFMERCMEELAEAERGYIRPRGKVESGGGNPRGGASRTFDKLPADAKAMCHDDNDTFVGPGKMFKTVREWEDHYAKLYGEG